MTAATYIYVRHVLTAMFDRLDSCVPPCVEPDDTLECGFNAYAKAPGRMFSRYVHGVMECAAAALAIVAAQAINDGVGIGDVCEDVLVPEVKRFMQARLKRPHTKMPNCDRLARRFVKEYCQLS